MRGRGVLTFLLESKIPIWTNGSGQFIWRLHSEPQSVQSSRHVFFLCGRGVSSTFQPYSDHSSHRKWYLHSILVTRGQKQCGLLALTQATQGLSQAPQGPRSITAKHTWNSHMALQLEAVPQTIYGNESSRSPFYCRLRWPYSEWLIHSSHHLPLTTHKFNSNQTCLHPIQWDNPLIKHLDILVLSSRFKCF
jgi:hypothetical protein